MVWAAMHGIVIVGIVVIVVRTYVRMLLLVMVALVFHIQLASAP